MKLTTTAQTTVSMTYDDALRPASYLAHNTVSGDIQSSSYVYSGDGMNKQITNGVHSEFNQISQYDFAGRLKKNDVGHSGATYPFKQTMSYDAFDNLTARDTYTWQDYHDNFSASYTNNRKTSGGTTDNIDSAGNVVQSSFNTSEAPGGGRSYNDLKKWTFDAAGRMTKWDEHGPWEAFPQTHSAETTYDGDGRPVMTTIVDDGGTFPWRYIFSSVTGQKIADVSPGYDPAIAANIYMGGSQIAQERDTDNTFDLHDPVTGSVQLMQPSGAAITTGEQSEMYPYHTEIAGLGTSVPVTQPAAFPLPHYPHGGFGSDAEYGCTMYVDGVWASEKKCTQSELAGLDGYTWATGHTVHTWGRYRKRSKDRGFNLVGTWDLTSTVGPSGGASLGAFFENRPLSADQQKLFEEGRTKAREALSAKKCQSAMAKLLRATAPYDFLPDFTLFARDGSSVSGSPLNDFLYDAKTKTSSYLNRYDAVTMEVGDALNERGFTTFGQTRGDTITWFPAFFHLSTGEERGLHVLHEIVHQFASDTALANAIAVIDKDKENGHTRTFSDTGQASDYLNKYLRRECNFGTPSPSDNGTRIRF